MSILFVLFYFLCWVVWACVSFLNVMYVVFRLQRNCIFCTRRCAIGILAACSAVRNQRLTSVLTVASLGSTWDPPWIGNNRRPFIFFSLVFVSYCLVRWECKLWWRIRKRSFCLFVVAVYFLHYSDVGRSCHRALCHLYVVFIICTQRNLEVLSSAAASISSLCMYVTPHCSCSWLYLRHMVATPVIMKQSRYLCFSRHCSVILAGNSQELL